MLVSDEARSQDGGGGVFATLLGAVSALIVMAGIAVAAGFLARGFAYLFELGWGALPL